MTRLLVVVSVSIFLAFFSMSAYAEEDGRYGQRLCGNKDFYCITIQEQEKEVDVQTPSGPKKVKKKFMPGWSTLFSKQNEREIVMRVNRLNIALEKGMVIAVPKDMSGKTFMDYSPFPMVMNTGGKKLMTWDPHLVAWAAYGADGKLKRWGPGAGGKDWCPDVGRPCHTVVGEFSIGYKCGPDCRSTSYPIGCWGSGCAPMPYFMEFHPAGYGFHGSNFVPGHNASHGCVRMYNADAEWLSKNFIEIGTKVIIRPYS